MPPAPKNRSFDRRIVDGPIPGAVWRLAWPTMLQNIIGGLQGIIDHIMVGRYVGFTGNAAIGVNNLPGVRAGYDIHAHYGFLSRDVRDRHWCATSGGLHLRVMSKWWRSSRAAKSA